MFGFGRKKKSGDNGLRLGTGDRDRFTATKSSEELARDLLATAQEKAKELPSGAEVRVELTEGHLNVHHMELATSLLTLGGEYGLMFVSQLDNSLTFRKL